ncbi:MAG: hypothetical protein ACO1NO_14220 [Burkholderiaceae bacterium]
MYESEDLNRIWEAICNSEFCGEYKPQKVFANKDLQIMCIPYEDAGGYDVYERRNGEDWILIPALKQQA